MSFHESVKRAKAIAYLLEHDTFIRAFVKRARESPAQAVEIAAFYGGLIQARIEMKVPKMIVTDDDRKHGYQMPNHLQRWPLDTESTGNEKGELC